MSYPVLAAVAVVMVAVVALTYFLFGKEDDSVIQRALRKIHPPVPKTIDTGRDTLRLVKRVKIIKDTSKQSPPQNAKPDWRAMYISDITLLGDGAKLIGLKDLSSIKLSSTFDQTRDVSNLFDSNADTFVGTAADDSMATITLTLREETWIDGIRIINRKDCCQDNLIGAQIITEDITGAPLWIGTFVGGLGQTFSINSQLPAQK